MENFFPYEIANLATGPVRVVYASPDDVAAVPTKIQDILGMEDPYTLKTGWKDFGAAVNPGSYSTGTAKNDLSIQNDTQPVDSEVTGVTRSLGFNVAELADEALQIIEGSPTVETIAAAAHAGAQKGLPFGTIDSADRFRVAFIGKRRKSAGIVTESGVGALERGRMFAVVLYSAEISGDTRSISFDRGNFASADVTFVAYPDPSAPAGKDGGRWLHEDAGTISAT